MARYRVENTIINADNAVKSWEEATRFYGRNHISKATGTPLDHETLYKSRKGRYYVEHTSQRQGAKPRAEWVSPEEACRWLLHNDHELPEDLEQYRDEVSASRSWRDV